MKKMMKELKPCPFCGGEAKVYSVNLFKHEIYVKCETCKSRTLTYKGGDFGDTAYLAIQAWNRRANDDRKN